MKLKRTLPVLVLLISLLFSFNIFAMSNYTEPERPMPQNEKKHEDRSLDYRWTWLNDSTCARFKAYDNAKKSVIERQYNAGIISVWSENTGNKYQIKNRDTYAGKWSQSSDGIWSFEFDDRTIPVGVTKIDGVLYAFNSYGELKEGYEYYDGFKTAADGLVKADSAEFAQWLTTQYLPECTSYE